MRALTVVPGQRDSAALRDISEPQSEAELVLLETLAVGVCGTDHEIIEAQYGQAPPGSDYLVLGHECLARVVAAPAESGLNEGDLAVPIVRHPDPVPCANCAIGEWDMCLNGRYTEHGITGLHGFATERFTMQPEFVVKLDPGLDQVGVLLEPTSVVAKAWEHIEAIGNRARWKPHRVLVTGAGPIGLLAAMLGVQRGLDVHVLDIVTEGPKPQLVRDLGATYHVNDMQGACSRADIVVECTGVPQLVFDAMQCTAPNGIVCLTGVSSGGRELKVDVGALNRSMVLQNDVVFGSVNANRRHYEEAAEALARAPRSWLERLITRREPLEQWQAALQKSSHDVKTIIDLTK